MKPMDIDETESGLPRASIDPLTLLDSSDASASATSNLIGTKLDDYQILRRLGRGGMADVYVALHQTLDRQVALKVLRRQLAGDAGYVERFRREARAAAKLNHPNIVHVYEVGRSNEYHYIAQELIDGGNLKDLVERRGPLTPENAADVLRSVCSALAAAHLAGITHRDIKPENILRSLRGETKVADFGLARVGPGNDLTQVGLTMGTPRYMSPEQVQGKTADARSDLYSLGCTMYFLLSGRPPFEAEDALAIALQHMHETPPPLATARGRDDVPDWLLAIVSRLMAKAPSDRFGDAGQVLAAIDQSGKLTDAGACLGGTAAATIQLQQTMKTESARRRKRRRRILLAISFPIVAGIAGAVLESQGRSPSIQRLLTPDLVSRKSTVEEQYIAAASRNDILAWKAVSEYFPSKESQKNAAYAVKAEIQLARLLSRTDRGSEAKAILSRIADDPSIDRVYQVIALADLIKLVGDDAQASKPLWAKLRQAHKTLLDNQPEAERILQLVIPETMQRLESS